MNKVLKMAAVAAVVSLIGAVGAVYAATAKTPAEIASEVTGKTVEAVQSERAEGKTYGTIASEEGKLEEFKSQMLEQRKVYLDQRVQEGTLTQEQADLMLKRMEENQITCDGTGNTPMRGQVGATMGNGQGMGKWQGMARGQGMGNGTRNGGGMNR